MSFDHHSLDTVPNWRTPSPTPTAWRLGNADSARQPFVLITPEQIARADRADRTLLHLMACATAATFVLGLASTLMH